MKLKLLKHALKQKAARKLLKVKQKTTVAKEKVNELTPKIKKYTKIAKATKLTGQVTWKAWNLYTMLPKG